MRKKKSSLLDGLSKEELLQKLGWIQEVVKLAEVMKTWDQRSRIRAVGTLLTCLLADDETDDDQAELVKLTVLAAEVGNRPGIAGRLADDAYMGSEVRERLAKTEGGAN